MPLKQLILLKKVDKFFDTFNVSSFTKGKFKRKVFQQPYRSANNFRLTVFVSIHVQLYILMCLYSFLVNCSPTLTLGSNPSAREKAHSVQWRGSK